MVAVLLALVTLTALLWMDLSQWEATPSVKPTEFAVILTLAMLNPITLVVTPTLVERIAKPMVLARLVSPTLIVELLTEVLPLVNLPATLPPELADLVKGMPIVLPVPPTVELMVVAILVLLDLPMINADLVLMVEKFPANPTAIHSPTLACLSVPMTVTALMIVPLTATLTVDAVSSVPAAPTALLATGVEPKLEEPNVASTLLASSLSLVKVMMTAPTKHLLAPWLSRSA
jgi:hypothetical protein